MNIQQINGSGHNIWVFAVTSVVALVVTGATWYLIEIINGVRVSARVAQDFEMGRPNYNLAYRLFMLWWLIIHGHSSWMWRTKAGFAILKNSDSFFPPSNEVNPSNPRIASACDYVAYFMHPVNAWESFGEYGNPFL